MGKQQELENVNIVLIVSNNNSVLSIQSGTAMAFMEPLDELDIGRVIYRLF